MRRAFAAFLPLSVLLSACQVEGLPGLSTVGSGAAPVAGPPRILSVQARAAEVAFRMSTGTTCRGVRPEGVQTGWSGSTDPECGYALPYRVEFRQGGRAQRFTIEHPWMGLGADGTPGPRAEVFVTDVDGQRKLFLSPLGSGTRLAPAPTS